MRLLTRMRLRTLVMRAPGITRAGTITHPNGPAPSGGSALPEPLDMRPMREALLLALLVA